MTYTSNYNSLPSANANTATRTAIHDGYNALFTNLDTAASLSSLPGTAQSLIFTCPAATVDKCTQGVIAFSYNSGAGSYTGNIINLCPVALTAPSQASFLGTITGGTMPDDVSLGFGILHEGQHIADLVGLSRRCEDKTAPSGNEAYSPAE